MDNPRMEAVARHYAAKRVSDMEHAAKKPAEEAEHLGMLRSAKLADGLPCSTCQHAMCLDNTNSRIWYEWVCTKSPADNSRGFEFCRNVSGETSCGEHMDGKPVYLGRDGEPTHGPDDTRRQQMLSRYEGDHRGCHPAWEKFDPSPQAPAAGAAYSDGFGWGILGAVLGSVVTAILYSL